MTNVSGGTDVAESQMYGSAFDCCGEVAMALSMRIHYYRRLLVVRERKSCEKNVSRMSSPALLRGSYMKTVLCPIRMAR